VLELRDRTKAGMTAPPQGLFLIGVEYGDLSECGARNSERGAGGNLDEKDELE
jgi:hypothetical protein